jgi:hypothetical protein
VEGTVKVCAQFLRAADALASRWTAIGLAQAEKYFRRVRAYRYLPLHGREQLAPAVDHPFIHRLQQLLCCGQQNSANLRRHAGLALFFIDGSFLPLGAVFFRQNHFQAGLRAAATYSNSNFNMRWDDAGI